MLKKLLAALTMFYAAVSFAAFDVMYTLLGIEPE